MSYISTLLSQLGESVTVRVISRSVNDWGDSTDTVTTSTVTMHVQLMDGSEDYVEEGVLSVGDLIAFVDPEDSNISSVVIGNEISYDGVIYRIKNVIKEPALYGDRHYEVQAERVNE